MNRPAFLPAYLVAFIAIFILALMVETNLVPQPLLAWTRGVLNASFIVLALLPVRGYSLKVTLACLCLALGIAWKAGVPLMELMGAFNRSAGIIAFFVVVPAIAVPIRLGAYMEAIETFLSHRRGRRISGFLLLVGLQLLLAIVLNIGSIPVMQKLLDTSRLPGRYRSLVYSTGYSIQMVLSPFDGVVNLMILSAGSSYAAYSVHGAGMALAILFAGLLLLLSDSLLFRVREPQDDRAEATILGLDDPEYRRAVVKIQGLMIHILVMIGFSVLAGKLLSLENPAMATALVIIGYSFAWTRLLRLPLTALKSAGREYVLTLAGFRSFIPFLVAASFLGAMSIHTPIRDIMGGILGALDRMPRYILLQGLMVLTTLLSIAGVHMMISVAAIGAALSPAALGLSAPGYALLLLSCWYIAMNASPLVPFTSIVAECLGEKPARVALRYNLRLSVLMILIAPLFIS